MLGEDSVVLVVDPTTFCELPDGEVGELWIYGPSNTAGYYNNSTATDTTFHIRMRKAVTELGKQNLSKSFVRSGDLGAWHNGELYVTGRIKGKLSPVYCAFLVNFCQLCLAFFRFRCCYSLWYIEMIIINGTKHYPHDIEETIKSAHPAIRPGAVVAFPMEMNDKENLVVIAELLERDGTSGQVLVLHCTVARIHVYFPLCFAFWRSLSTFAFICLPAILSQYSLNQLQVN